VFSSVLYSDGCVAIRTSGLKNPDPLIPTDSFPEQAEEDLADPGSTRNKAVKWN